MVSIILTGGPGAGKSSMLKTLREYAISKNRKIVTVGEVPSLLNYANLPYQLENGNNPIYDELSVTIQVEFERLAAELAGENDIVVFDRALPDRLPYLEKDQTYITPDAISNALLSYNYVIYLDSPAFTDASQLALDMGGEKRNETNTEQMADLALKTLSVWQEREIIRVPWYQTIDERIEKFTAILDEIFRAVPLI
ncbi:MAG: ATP-binding protein [Oscillospiraceae bacterium]|jgi:predicted ATPase|nr:ATP-binding protein [Oscillospiraceae bacterium]